MIEVFKTDICHKAIAENIVAELLRHFPKSQINFDLDDCDKVLRVVGDEETCLKIAKIIISKGFLCEALE